MRVTYVVSAETDGSARARWDLVSRLETAAGAGGVVVDVSPHEELDLSGRLREHLAGKIERAGR